MGRRGPPGSLGEHAKKRRRGGASEQGCPRTGSGGAASLEAGEFAGEMWGGGVRVPRTTGEERRGKDSGGGGSPDGVSFVQNRRAGGTGGRRRFLAPES